jgi:hypothetical protein
MQAKLSLVPGQMQSKCNGATARTWPRLRHATDTRQTPTTQQAPSSTSVQSARRGPALGRAARGARAAGARPRSGRMRPCAVASCARRQASGRATRAALWASGRRPPRPRAALGWAWSWRASTMISLPLGELERTPADRSGRLRGMHRNLSKAELIRQVLLYQGDQSSKDAKKPCPEGDMRCAGDLCTA